MVRIAAVLLLVGAGRVSAQPASASQSPPDSIARLLPVGEVRVSVMRLSGPPRLDGLMRRFREAISRDPAWMQQYVRENDLPAGETLPYHPNMGLSREEYDDMVLLMGRMVLMPVSEARLTIARLSSGITLDGEPDLARFTGITVDPERATVQTPLGTLAEVERVHPSAGQAITGPWDGYAWVLDEFDPDTGTGVRITLDLGRRTDQGDAILAYDARRMEAGRLIDRVKWTLTYPLEPR